jgi:hypothetical protein
MSCKSAIMASKIFMSIDSDRRKKILTALADPINVELVEQLDEYLDDEYKQMNDSSTETEPVAEVDTEDTTETAEDTSAAPRGSSSPSAPRPSLFEKHKDELTEGDEDWDPDSTSGTNDSADTDTEEDTTIVENSTKVSKTKVMADTTTLNPMAIVHNTINNIAFEIKGLLNAKADTAGVVRVNVKNDEVWVYYNDDTNLNNVMTSAIESLNAASYAYLIFNRLARTDNAIVFTISINDTDAVMKPVQSDEK